ncbi:C4-dicarboxylate ABC transporter permease [Pokkaliibacter plantistimulans]|uniref:TRAP transporter large permease protein n=1 Tax=Pokkaliibacter plantistimulans TaxID=1635171 RepID=A0ABX5M1W4_9GAMM|nr:TRAP transporter large permease [Pokkaliibacter plantistimulans]PXF31668.1 C4-dicarboxylate ABC transporter permease [Pokkaliibacter plantistimulans]
MSSEMIGGMSMGILLLLLVLRVPIALSMLLVGFFGFAAVTSMDAAISMLKSVPQEVLANYDYSAIPMFIFMGVLASHSGMAKQLFNAARSMFGGWRGGMALAAVSACGVFSAISGSSLATASTMSRVALPEMERSGYAPGLAAGTLAAGGTLGIMIPPSIALLLYAIITEQSVGDMFMAGILPGLAGLLFYIITVAVVVKFWPHLAGEAASTTWAEKFRAVLGMVPFALVFLMIIGGIYGGIFTPTEAAAVGAFITLLYAISQHIGWQGFMQAVKETLILSSVIFFMLLGATVFGYLISASRISFSIVDYVVSLNMTTFGVMACILLMYFVLGCFMDSIAMLLLTVPVVFPIVVGMGIDPVWFGVVTVLTVELGLITPPVGMNVFVIQAMAPHIAINKIFRGVTPFIISDFVRLGVLLAFPIMATAFL